MGEEPQEYSLNRFNLSESKNIFFKKNWYFTTKYIWCENNSKFENPSLKIDGFTWPHADKAPDDSKTRQFWEKGLQLINFWGSLIVTFWNWRILELGDFQSSKKALNPSIRIHKFAPRTNVDALVHFDNFHLYEIRMSIKYLKLD